MSKGIVLVTQPRALAYLSKKWFSCTKLEVMLFKVLGKTRFYVFISPVKIIEQQHNIQYTIINSLYNLRVMIEVFGKIKHKLEVFEASSRDDPQAAAVLRKNLDCPSIYSE